MGFERKQFTFYRSFYLAAAQLPAKKRAEFVWALIEYALDEIEPSTKDVTIRSVFESVRPVLDKARIKAQAGKNGGLVSPSASQANGSKTQANGSKTQANGSKTQAKKEGEKEKEKEKEIEGEGEKEAIASPHETTVEGFPEVLMALRIVGVELRDQEQADAERLCAQYGKQAILEAIDRAKEANVPRWSYIRAIVVSGGVHRQGGGGVSRRVRESNAQCQKHNEVPPPDSAFGRAIREMLAEDFGDEEDQTADKQGLSLHGEHDAPEQEGKA